MKRFILLALLALATTFVACDKEPEVVDPEVPEEKPDDKPEETPTAPVLRLSQNSVEFEAEGGEVSITYTIENPIEGESVVVSATADWLTVDSSTEGTITLTATENTKAEGRTAEVSIEYKDSTGHTIAVSQSEREVTGPTFEINFSDIYYDNFTVQILPSDPSITFYFNTMERSLYETFESDEALYQSEMVALKAEAENIYLTFEELLESRLYKGEKWQAVNQLRAETEYVFFVFGLTKRGERTSSISYDVVTTTAEPTIDMTFEIEVTEYHHTMNISITPERKREAYVWDVFTKEDIEARMMAEGLSSPAECYAPIMKERVEKALAEGGSIESFYNSVKVKGTKWGLQYECAPSTEYYVMAAALNKSCVPGAVTFVEYTSEPMATPGCSDNEISVSLTNPTATYAQLNGEASNMDPFIVLVLPTTLADTLSDEELFAYFQANYTGDEIIQHTYEGSFTSFANNLTPSTAYTAVAFGYEDEVMTTTYVARSESVTTLAE